MDLANLNPDVYTFASPRVFNNTGALLLNSLLPNINRIYNTEDLIPNLPPFSQENGQYYTHTGINVPFTLNLGTFFGNHVTAYWIFVNYL